MKVLEYLQKNIIYNVVIVAQIIADIVLTDLTLKPIKLILTNRLNEHFS